MANRIVRSDDLEHMGVRGMKWGVRRAARKTASLDRKVHKKIRKYDRGGTVYKDEIASLSSNVRVHKYKLTKKVKRANRFLKKAAKADANKFVNRYNRDPEKRKATEDYIKALESNYPTLGELRLALIDVRI